MTITGPNILHKLLKIQTELKAPKGQYNSFGKYAYRSCEDILEAAKPLCTAAGCVLVISDELFVQSGRFYVKATATIFDAETSEAISNTALAREPEAKKGMDESQITGTASSYARKYALNGLFCIDDTKDADSDEYTKAAERQSKPRQQSPPVTCSQCGAEVKPFNGKNGKLSAKEFSQKSGGLCLDCYKKTQKT